MILQLFMQIFNIAVKHEFYGHEIAGIKLHAPIDTQIHHNYIHHCSLGIWLDWQVQGTRISSNILDMNNRDIMIEVTHGPHIVDNNIFTSEFSIVNVAQRYSIKNRTTPYHLPHSTDVGGVAFVYGRDDRWYQNVFFGGNVEDDAFAYGTACFNDAPVSMEEYLDRLYAIAEESNDLDHALYFMEKQPVYIDGNVYYKEAPHFEREEHYFSTAKDPQVRILDEGDDVYLEMYVDEEMLAVSSNVISTEMLGVPRIVEQRFENPDGTEILFDRDLNENLRGVSSIAGPIENLVPGYNKVKV